MEHKEEGMLRVNEYFDGHVKSIGFEDAEGSATIGAMDRGEYRFTTSTVEVMSVITGHMAVRLPGSSEWAAFSAGTAFTVAKNESFDVRVDRPSTYVCRYR